MLKVIKAPEEELISVDDAVEFMRIDDPSDAEETLIESMITASRQWCEDYLRRAIGVQTLELRLRGFPGGPILLRPPLIEVVSVKYLDQNREEVTMDEADYVVSDSEPIEISPIGSWPSAYNSADSVRVRFQCGYDAAGSPVTSRAFPKTIRTAILMQVADLYANREAQFENSRSQSLSANPTLERLLSQYRLEMGI